MPIAWEMPKWRPKSACNSSRKKARKGRFVFLVLRVSVVSFLLNDDSSRTRDRRDEHLRAIVPSAPAGNEGRRMNAVTRTDAARNLHRCYRLDVQRDLFGQ